MHVVSWDSEKCYQKDTCSNRQAIVIGRFQLYLTQTSNTLFTQGPQDDIGVLSQSLFLYPNPNTSKSVLSLTSI